MTNQNQSDAKGGPFRGAMTAIVTPYEPGGQIDHRALSALVRWQVESGINGIVPAGTTTGLPLPCASSGREIGSAPGPYSQTSR